jgi:peptidoglycan/xylan/chitin deacetylase (PgdA/CDA1 family)
VDTVRPIGTWKGLRPGRASGLSPIAFRFLAEDRPADLQALLEIHDPVGPVTAKKLVIQPGSHEVHWLPRHGNGKPLLPGLYRVSLSIEDEAGNVSVPNLHRQRVIRPMRATVVRRVAGAGRKVALTIDDCHYRSAWTSMLSVLRRLRVKATFFCPGDRMVLFPDLVRRTIQDGHLLGSHGWDHSVMAGRRMPETRWQIARSDATVWRLARASTAPYFRPPYGSFDGAVVAASGAAGHPRVIMWDVNSRDTSRPGPAAIVANAVGPARGGSIILLHTIDQTASALPGIIRGLRRKNLQPVTLAHLFRAAGFR